MVGTLGGSYLADMFTDGVAEGYFAVYIVKAGHEAGWHVRVDYTLLTQRVEPLPHGEALLPPPARPRVVADGGLQLTAEPHETE